MAAAVLPVMVKWLQGVVQRAMAEVDMVDNDMADFTDVTSEWAGWELSRLWILRQEAVSHLGQARLLLAQVASVTKI